VHTGQRVDNNFGRRKFQGAVLGFVSPPKR
jgi:hypothetical protein